MTRKDVNRSYLLTYLLTAYRNAFHCCHQFDVLLDKLLTHRFVYDFCISKVDNESVHLAYSLLELIFVQSGSFSVSKNFADTDIQTMIDALRCALLSCILIIRCSSLV